MVPPAWVAVVLVLAATCTGVPAAQSPVDVWATVLKPQYFAGTAIIEDRSVIELATPYRAEDAAVTPVRIKAQIPQTPERYIKTIHLFVDDNPVPLAAVFHFTLETRRADLALRVRIERYTHVRAVAVLNTGEHHMAANFVKAQGGCSIPLTIDYPQAMAGLGRLQLRTLDAQGGDDGFATLLRIRHPNMTGLQMDYKIYAVRPAHFVKTIRVSLDGRLVMSAETGIAISEDPSFRFFLHPQSSGRLTAEVTDSKGGSWSGTLSLERPL